MPQAFALLTIPRILRRARIPKNCSNSICARHTVIAAAMPSRAVQSVESRGEPRGSDMDLQGLSRDVVSADIPKQRAADKEADRCFLCFQHAPQS